MVKLLEYLQGKEALFLDNPKMHWIIYIYKSNAGITLFNSSTDLALDQIAIHITIITKKGRKKKKSKHHAEEINTYLRYLITMLSR